MEPGGLAVGASQRKALEWERIRQYFQHAVELEPAEREIYLQSVCGDDVHLRVEVRALLAEHDRASGLLATGPSNLPPTGLILIPGDCLAERFEIVRLIGAGGMGEVYEAHDRKLGEQVALKVLRPELVHDAKSRERFKYEILNGRKVTHPNICRIHDLAADYQTDRPFLAFTMELIEGETLAAYLARQPGKRISTAQALPLATQMVAGLEALHGKSIVHRDFKPGNVILAGETNGIPQVRITDFGLALWSEELGPALSTPRDIIGTPIYMAPEQLTGDRAKVSGATDIYALGLVLYEMVTGARPYAAETLVGNAIQKTQQPPTPPRAHVPDLNDKWESTILCCLAREPQHRPARVAQVIELLEGRVSAAGVHRTPHLSPDDNNRGTDATSSSTAASPVPSKKKIALPTRSAWKWVAAALMVATVTVLALLPSSREWGAAQACQFAPQWFGICSLPAEKHLVIQGISSVGSANENSLFADGMLEELNRRLSQLTRFDESFCVHSPIGGQPIGVTLVLGGVVEREGDNVRVSMTLKRPDSSVTIRSIEHQAALADVGGLSLLEDDLVLELAELLQIELSSDARLALTRGGTVIPRAFEAYIEGLGFLLHDDLDNAETRFREALVQDEYYARARVGLGDVFRRRAQATKSPEWLRNAKESYLMAREATPESDEIYVSLGQIDALERRFSWAIENFQQALNINEANPDAQRELAAAFVATEQLVDANAVYKRAIRTTPGCWIPHNALGALYDGQARYEEAEREFKHALELSPNNPVVYSNLGGLYLHMDLLEQAVDMLEKSLSIQPKASAYSNLGIAYLRANCFTDAAYMMQQAVDLGVNNYLIWGNLAEAYEYVPELADRAPRAFREAVELGQLQLAKEPTNVQALRMLAYNHAKLGEIQQAAKYIEEALQRAPKHENTLFRAALVFELSGERERALATLRASIEGGYSKDEIRNSTVLEELRKDERYREIDEEGFELERLREDKTSREKATGCPSSPVKMAER